MKLRNLAAAVFLVSLGRDGPALSEDAGVALLHKMQAALGGAEKIAAIKDFEQTQSAESFDGSGNSIGDVRKRTRWIRPSSIRVDQTGPGSTYVLYFDGRSGWEVLPGTTKAVELTGGELEFARGYVRGFFLLMWLADRDSRYKLTSPEANVVRISDGDLSHQLDFTLDPKTGLLVKETSLSLSDPAHPVTSDKVFEAWTTSDGVRFPDRFSVLRSGRRVAIAKSLDEARINQGLKLEDLTAKPPDGKPVFRSAAK
ncbi:MAG TPA: hypothetical protein VKG01_00895 [Thermoanaerobaculia bacterium]|nr:hypothetical protein [Thermoanaerobaculia bacterium]